MCFCETPSVLRDALAVDSLPTDVVHALELSLEGRSVGPSGVQVGSIAVFLEPPQLLHSPVAKKVSIMSPYATAYIFIDVS